MGDQRNGGIAWTDETWNPLRGCSRVSEGCRHCYAEQVAGRFSGPGQAFEGLATRVDGKGRWTSAVRLIEDKLTDPLRWRRPRRVFVNSVSDLFHESVTDALRDRIFAAMALCPHHTFQVLTKRPERMREYLGRDFRDTEIANAIRAMGRDVSNWTLPLPNVWLGTSIENQAAADERIPHLLATPAAVRFVSAEPLLGAVDLTNIKPPGHHHGDAHGWSAIWRDNGLGREWLDWVIVGGESGPHARPMCPDWVRSLRDQCAAAEVPFLFKQWGEWSPHVAAIEGPDGSIKTTPKGGLNWQRTDRDGISGMFRVGKRAAGRLLDGVEHNAFPQVRP
ncbi:MAG TPA: phage Gp37/Gp68 family protein [Patescibacteria group bacterium]|nr:phage Gp37/Gp68 family protein [Patescibacteria group bacterium]